MNIKIQIPPKKLVLAGGYIVPIAPKGTSWSDSLLGARAKDRGVYVIHHSDSIKYVGKTSGSSMSFAMRLRREFQETASQKRHIYPKLKNLVVPPDIKVYLIGEAQISKLVKISGLNSAISNRIEIFEAALIGAYNPEFQN